MSHHIVEEISIALASLRTNKPLVHNITNHVVMNYTANALLAVGASPIMAHSIEEVEEIVGICNALVLNIGTLEPKWIESMKIAAQRAKLLGIPVTLDPVGSGATRLRTTTAIHLLESGCISILRGNASEILSLKNHKIVSGGVDSTHAVSDAESMAIELASKHNNVVAVTGRTDFVTDGTTSLYIAGGSSMMPYVTGTGCTASALTGAFSAICKTPLVAVSAALALWKLAGENAAKKAEGPGSLQSLLLDQLYLINPEEMAENINISIL